MRMLAIGTMRKISRTFSRLVFELVYLTYNKELTTNISQGCERLKFGESGVSTSYIADSKAAWTPKGKEGLRHPEVGPGQKF